MRLRARIYQLPAAVYAIVAPVDLLLRRRRTYVQLRVCDFFEVTPILKVVPFLSTRKNT